MFRSMEWNSERHGRAIAAPGAGLAGSPLWAANASIARIGRQGELRTAALIDAAARRYGFTVLHDLRVPIPGFSANADHIVVSGRQVLLLDTKVWRPGFYWTFDGASFRGFSRFAPADKKTMKLAQHVLVVPGAARAVAGVRSTADCDANRRRVAVTGRLAQHWPDPWIDLDPGLGPPTRERVPQRLHDAPGRRDQEKLPGS